MNIKGGSGKTTIANELAYSLDHTETPYSFFNLDPQGGSPHVESLDDAAVIQIADTPGHPTMEEIARYARAANIVVIPVRSSILDAHAFIQTLNIVREVNPSVQIIIIQNGWNRWTAAREFTEWLQKNAPGIPILPLSQSEMIVQATAQKRSVTDRAPRSRVAEQMRVIVNTIREAAGLELE